MMIEERNAAELDCCESGSPPWMDSFIDGLSGEITGDMNSMFGRQIGPQGMWDFALDLAFHDDPKVAFRGSWALEWAYFNDRDAFRPHTAHFVENYLRAANPSVHRHYAKMLWDMQRRGVLTLDDARAESVAEKTFDLLINPKTKVAVKVWCMEILYDLSPRLPWVGEQLEDVVRQILQSEPSRGVANRAGKLLKRMDVRHGQGKRK